MKRLLLLGTLLMTWSLSAADAPQNAGQPLSPEARKRRYAALQKELEASRPQPEAPKEEVLTYLELGMDSYGKFAKENPKTVEGFEAALTMALLLAQVHHPQGLKFAELAIESAPAAGVDVKRIATAWALVAGGRLGKGDFAGCRTAVDNIKPLDAELFAQVSSQLESIEQQRKAQQEIETKLQPGREPFAITEKDVNGNAVSLEALKGKVVVIDFWAPWCGPCMGEMPNLKRLYQQQHAHGLEVVAISLDEETADGFKETLQKQAMTWTTISDHLGFNSALARKWGINSIPANYILDRKGIIRHHNLRGEELSDAVLKLLQEAP